MDPSYINDNGKLVAGSAAILHYIYTVMGGIENYNDSVGEVYINKFVKHVSVEANKHIERNMKKKRFKAL